MVQAALSDELSNETGSEDELTETTPNSNFHFVHKAKVAPVYDLEEPFETFVAF